MGCAKTLPASPQHSQNHNRAPRTTTKLSVPLKRCQHHYSATNTTTALPASPQYCQHHDKPASTTTELPAPLQKWYWRCPSIVPSSNIIITIMHNNTMQHSSLYTTNTSPITHHTPHHTTKLHHTTPHHTKPHHTTTPTLSLCVTMWTQLPVTR